MPRIGFNVPANKVAGYLLNLSHPKGGGKAKFFIAQGFSPLMPKVLEDALLAHTDHGFKTVKVAFGTKYIFKGPITTPSGKTPTVWSVWMRADNATETKLVTAYPAAPA